jgi:hypothetical protein
VEYGDGSNRKENARERHAARTLAACTFAAGKRRVQHSFIRIVCAP